MTDDKRWNQETIDGLIQEFGLSNTKLATLCGVHWVTVSRWRNGTEPTALAQQVLTGVEEKLRAERAAGANEGKKTKGK